MLIAPDRVHDGQCHQHPGSDCGIYLAELAAVDATTDYPGQHVQHSRNDFVGVELGEVRELVKLAQYKPIDGAEDGGADELPVAAHGYAELLGGSTLGRGFLASLDRGDRGLPDHLLKELFLVGEVEVDGAFGDSGAVGDVLESGFGESAFTENLEGGLDDLLWPVLGSSAPLGRFCGSGSGTRHS